MNARGLGILSGLLFITALLLYSVHTHLHFNLETYVHFADQRTILGVDHFWNVITNLGFFWIGLQGLTRFKISQSWQSFFFSLGVFGTAFGSSFFHYMPIPKNLFWDQLPMSLGFASFVGVLVADRIDPKISNVFTPILILWGVVSVWEIYFGSGETQYYLWLQIGALIFSLLLLITQPKGQIRNGPLYFGLAAYIVAKVLEAKDQAIFDSLGFISGHSLKHLLATVALAAIMRGLSRV